MEIFGLLSTSHPPVIQHAVTEAAAERISVSEGGELAFSSVSEQTGGDGGASATYEPAINALSTHRFHRPLSFTRLSPAPAHKIKACDGCACGRCDLCVASQRVVWVEGLVLGRRVFTARQGGRHVRLASWPGWYGWLRQSHSEPSFSDGVKIAHRIAHLFSG